MHRAHGATIAALSILTQCALFGAPALKPGKVTVGKDLQVYTTIVLSEPATADVQLTVTSSDPARMLLSTKPDVAGSASLTLTVKYRYRESPEFWVQALGDTGEVAFTASAPGFDAGTGTVTLAPSGLVVIGPFQAPGFVTTPRAWPSKITLNSGRLDSSLNYVEPQYVRGGFKLEARITVSNPEVGKVTPAPVVFSAANYAATAEFQPAGAGTATLGVVAPPGFKTPANMNSVTVTVRIPGMALADDTTVGENLQIQASLNLGEPAPPGGLVVTLKSADPKKMLLSKSRTDLGKPSIEITIPAGGLGSPYYVQALDKSGTVEHTASAPGYNNRTGTIALAPSGIIISHKDHGPPDEAEVFRPESAGGPQNGFIEHLSKASKTPLIMYAAYLDPRTRRAADITVQQLRGGLTLSIKLANSNAAVGTVPATVTFEAGAERALMSFQPKTVGQTVISVLTPDRFTPASNSTELMAIVKE